MIPETWQRFLISRDPKEMSTQTAGLGAGVVLALDTDASAHAITLSLSGTSTHQLVATVKDIAGTTQTATQAVCFISRSPYVCMVTSGGLITAAHLGIGIVEASYPFNHASYGPGPDGLPPQKIMNELIVTVKV
jgi:hypothetical protein